MNTTVSNAYIVLELIQKKMTFFLRVNILSSCWYQFDRLVKLNSCVFFLFCFFIYLVLTTNVILIS